MRFLRRLGLLALLAVGSAVLASPASATAPDPSLTYQLGSTHFLVHFTTDIINNPTFAITATQAGDIAAFAERAYTAETADGYAAPLSDAGLGGDNRVDIYVQDMATLGEAGEADPDNIGPSSGFILLDSVFGTSYHVIAHELFHVIQFGIYASSDITDGWLYEASAEWMGYRTDGYSTSGGTQPITVGHNEFSLDCRDPVQDQILCARDVYYDNGYSRWPFFQFLADRYGNAFMKDIFTQLAANGPGTSLASLTAALVAKGTTISDTYNAWATAELTGAYSVKVLQGLKPSVYASVSTGVTNSGTTVTKVPLNHLSTRFVKFTRGDDDAAHVCYDATLNISVALPAGTSSKPAFYWDVKGGSPVQLTVNGSTASADIPWDTCTYTSNAGYLVLPNASTSIDAADFVVTTKLTVKATQATPVAPPEPAFTTTPAIPVTSVDVAPTLFLFGPELLKLSATDTQLRLIVQSNGQGTVQAKLGSVVLGTLPVRGGNNDLRFKLPAGLLLTLRRAAAAGNVLTLTPVSQSGVVTGDAVTRTVSVLTAPHKVAKHKATKRKVKAKLHRK
jgi:hypothetical protein